MSIKAITKTVYQTTDGQQFDTNTEAIEHQEYLDTPKVFIIISSSHRICKCYSDEKLATNEVTILNRGYSGTHYTIVTSLLETK